TRPRGSVRPLPSPNLGTPPHPLRGFPPRRADGLSRAIVRAAIGHAPKHALWRLLSRGYWLPASRALLYIRVVTLGILAIVPERGSSRRLARRLGGELDLRSGLHIDRRGRDDNRWVVGIWLPIVGSPVRPYGDDDAGPNE